MATNVSGSKALTQKPQSWNFDPSCVSPEWSWFWEDLTILIPCMEGGGRPMFYLMGNNPIVPILTNGNALSDATGSGYESYYTWERDPYGLHLHGNNVSTSGSLFLLAPVSHSIDGNEYFNWENHGPFSVTTYTKPAPENNGTSNAGSGQVAFAWTRTGSVSQDSVRGPAFLNGTAGNNNKLEYVVKYGATTFDLTSSVAWNDYPDFKGRPTLSGITVNQDDQKLYVDGFLSNQYTYNFPAASYGTFKKNWVSLMASCTGTLGKSTNYDSAVTNGFDVYYIAVHKKILTEQQHRQLRQDPYGPFRHKLDTIHTNVYPRQRDFSQKRIPKFAPKPPSWNIDSTLVDPELEQFVSNAKLMIPVLEQGNSLSVYGTGDNPVFQGNAKVAMTEYGPALDFDGTNGTRVDVSSKNIIDLLGITSHTGSYWTLSLMRCRDVNTRQTAWGSHINIWHAIEISQNTGDRAIYYGSYGSVDASTPQNFINDNDLVLIYTEAQNVSGSGWRSPFTSAQIMTKIYAHNLTTGKFSFDANYSNNPSVSTGGWGFTLGAKANVNDGGEFNGQIFYWIGGSGLLNFTESPISVFDGGGTRLPGTPISEKLINDPFAIFRQHKDTIHTNVYPIQRNYSQNRIIYKLDKPKPWNI